MNDEDKKKRAAYEAQRRYRAKLAENAEQLAKNKQSRREAQQRFRDKKRAQQERQYSFFLTQGQHDQVMAFINELKKNGGSK